MHVPADVADKTADATEQPAEPADTNANDTDPVPEPPDAANVNVLPIKNELSTMLSDACEASGPPSSTHVAIADPVDSRLPQ